MKNGSEFDGRQIAFVFFLLLALVAVLLTGCAGIGGTKTFKIGVINLAPAFDPIMEGFKAGMEEAGYSEGKNIEYIYDGPAANPDALNTVIANLKSEQVDLVLSFGTLATLRTKEGLEGTDIPIVFGPVTDPVASGIIKEILKPGGNITGIQTGNPTPKRLDWLMRFVPTIKRISVFHNPNDNSSIQALGALKETAPQFNVELVVQEASTADEIKAQLNNLPDDVDAIFMLASAVFEANIKEFVATANARKLPLAAPATANVWDGALTSYGHDNVLLGKQASGLAKQILQGISPSNLPVESADLLVSINVKTAETIGLTIPDDLLRSADLIVR